MTLRRTDDRYYYVRRARAAVHPRLVVEADTERK